MQLEDKYASAISFSSFLAIVMDKCSELGQSFSQTKSFKLSLSAPD